MFYHLFWRKGPRCSLKGGPFSKGKLFVSLLEALNERVPWTGRAPCEAALSQHYNLHSARPRLTAPLCLHSCQAGEGHSESLLLHWRVDLLRFHPFVVGGYFHSLRILLSICHFQFCSSLKHCTWSHHYIFEVFSPLTIQQRKWMKMYVKWEHNIISSFTFTQAVKIDSLVLTKY